VPGFTSRKSLEVRFFAPGNLVSNLDFVENIFGNGGDPFLPENDAALDAEHWTGHTGCVILAPHLITVTKKDAGLPYWDKATERQRRDGMCWKTESGAIQQWRCFQADVPRRIRSHRHAHRGQLLRLLQKEVKTQISYAANLYGMCEEEHAGGALVFPAFDLGEEFDGDIHVKNKGHNFAEVSALYGSLMDVQPEGYAVDKKYPDIFTFRKTHRSICRRKRFCGPRARWSSRSNCFPVKRMSARPAIG